jgi:hypothetical protein
VCVCTCVRVFLILNPLNYHWKSSELRRSCTHDIKRYRYTKHIQRPHWRLGWCRRESRCLRPCAKIGLGSLVKLFMPHRWQGFMHLIPHLLVTRRLQLWKSIHWTFSWLLDKEWGCRHLTENNDATCKPGGYCQPCSQDEHWWGSATGT